MPPRSSRSRPSRPSRSRPSRAPWLPAPSLYASPEVYDVAAGWDLTLELRFLERCFRRHGSGDVRRVLEPACGTGRHLLALAERGYRVSGYDRSQEMVAYAAARLRPFRGRVEQGEMTTHRPRGRFDAAINLVNSIGYLLTDQEMSAHLACVGDALRTGGIYLVHLSYAGEPPERARFGPWGNRRDDLSTTFLWEVVREDVKRRRSYQHCRLTARRGRERCIIDEEHVLRLWTQEDFDRLVAASPFTLEAIYWDRFEPFPLDEPRTGECGNLYHVLVRRGRARLGGPVTAPSRARGASRRRGGASGSGFRRSRGSPAPENRGRRSG